MRLVLLRLRENKHAATAGDILVVLLDRFVADGLNQIVQALGVPERLTVHANGRLVWQPTWPAILMPSSGFFTGFLSSLQPRYSIGTSAMWRIGCLPSYLMPASLRMLLKSAKSSPE
jgi:hypothetical protein